MNDKTCPTCHAPVPPHAPGGFCPACLLRDADELPLGSPDAPSLEEIAAAFPQLDVLGFIGQGGMGSVYQARQPGLDRIVALKILSPELGRDPAFAERFAREARVLGKLNHPNIVTVFEHGESGGFFYLLMEFVDGVNLRQAMRAGRFTPEQALALVPGICDALHAAHEQGVWHRDIKPENILLDARGGVKIADFGIARIVGDPQRDFTLTRTGGMLGSAAYMAPEQHENPRNVDHRADIYSLGVVIYEMLTGELPLGRFPAPSQRADVNARIDEIVFRTLEKERELRQQSAAEVKTDVQGADHAPAVPKPVTGQGPDRADRNFRLSLGLWLGGVVACAAGLLTSPLLLGLGMISAVVGLGGCWWILWSIRQGRHPEVHRLPLLVAAFWPTATGIAYASVLFWFLHFKRAGFTSAPDWNTGLFGYAVVAIALPLLAAGFLWKTIGSGPAPVSSRHGRAIRVALAIILATASISLVKFVGVREASYRSYHSKFIQLSGEIHDAEDLPLIRDALDRALGDSRSDFRVRLHGSKDKTKPPSIAPYETPYVELECTSRDRMLADSRFQAIAGRLRASLPKRIDVNDGAGGVNFPDSSDAPRPIREGYRRIRPLNLILLLAPVATVLLACALPFRILWAVPVFSLLAAATLQRSSWPGTPDHFPPVIDPRKTLLPLSPPEYDFSTTRDAMESMIKAAKKRDVEGFKRGISSKLLENVLAETSDLSEPMRDIARLGYRYQDSQTGDTARVRMTRDGKNMAEAMPLVRENGDWKLALPDPQP